MSLVRPTEYEYKALMEVGQYREAAVKAYELHERLQKEADKWLNLAADAQLKVTLAECDPGKN